jgi:methyltransferase
VTSALLLAVVCLPMLIEAWRAARNERAQRASGGIEPPGDVYPIMQLAYPGAFLAMIAEGAVRGGAPVPAVTSGAVLFALAKALKWWAILSLGQAWTFRVIVVPRAPLVGSGPYRFMRHPNYVGVIGELVGVALMTGAWIAGPLTTAGFAGLILRRIQIETRALSRVPYQGRPDP